MERVSLPSLSLLMPKLIAPSPLTTLEEPIVSALLPLEIFPQPTIVPLAELCSFPSPIVIIPSPSRSLSLPSSRLLTITLASALSSPFDSAQTTVEPKAPETAHNKAAAKKALRNLKDCLNEKSNLAIKIP